MQAMSGLLQPEPDDLADIGERELSFSPCRKKELCQHDNGTLRKNSSLAFIRFEQEMRCCGQERILGVFAQKRVIAVPDAGWVNDIHVTKCASIACGLGKQFAFDVIDNNASLPGEELAGCQESFAASGWRDNQQIAKLTARRCWPDTEKMG